MLVLFGEGFNKLNFSFESPPKANFFRCGLIKQLRIVNIGYYFFKGEEEMKKVFSLGLMLSLILGLLGTAEAQSAKLDLKVGDSVYACNCGEGCPCNTMARKPGNCACGKEMVEAKVTQVEDGKAYLQAQNWPQPLPFPTVGKYACACGPDCPARPSARNPGNAAAGQK